MVMKYADNIVKVKTIYIVSDGTCAFFPSMHQFISLVLGVDLYSCWVDHGPILMGTDLEYVSEVFINTFGKTIFYPHIS